MKVELDAPVPVIPSNYTNKEVVAHVRHYYPNLQGALKTMLDRLEGSIDSVATVEELEQADNSITCPHCGSVMAIDLELQS